MNTRLFQGDCLEIVRKLDAESVHLVYLDPPFFTQKTHRLLTKDRQREFSFDDAWSSQAEFAGFLQARLKEIRRVMHPAGSLFFHCDRNASHIVRFMLEELFGTENFQAEIIWHYKRWSNSQKNLLPAHQTIFYFTKSDTFTFNTIYEDYSVTTNVDQILQRRKRDADGKSVYELDRSGEFVPGAPKKGVPISDVWQIPFLNPKAKERVGYPTQKPVLLLERIIRIASKENDLILDPFCGSGTTLVAATLLNRRAIGIDISIDAIEVSRRRLAKPFKSDSKLLKSGRDAYRSANQDALAMLKGLDIVPVQRNMGIDAFLKDHLDGSPIPIRVQRPHETIPEAASLLYKAAKTKKARVMFLIAIREGGFFPFGNELPSEVHVIDGPALSVAKNLGSFKVNKKDK